MIIHINNIESSNRNQLVEELKQILVSDELKDWKYFNKELSNVDTKIIIKKLNDYIIIHYYYVLKDCSNLMKYAGHYYIRFNVNKGIMWYGISSNSYRRYKRQKQGFIEDIYWYLNTINKISNVIKLHKYKKLDIVLNGFKIKQWKPYLFSSGFIKVNNKYYAEVQDNENKSYIINENGNILYESKSKIRLYKVNNNLLVVLIDYNKSNIKSIVLNEKFERICGTDFAGWITVIEELNAFKVRLNNDYNSMGLYTIDGKLRIEHKYNDIIYGENRLSKAYYIWGHYEDYYFDRYYPHFELEQTFDKRKEIAELNNKRNK